jgi:hypothetical protein
MLEDEIIELLDPIKAAWLEVFGHEYPLMWTGTVVAAEAD